MALAVFYFAVPFLVLLGRQNKRQHQRLATIAVGHRSWRGCSTSSS